MGFTDGFTFIIEPPLFASPRDPASGKIIRRHLDCNFVAREYADKIHSQLSRDVRQYGVSVANVHLKCGVGQRLNDSALTLDYIIF